MADDKQPKKRGRKPKKQTLLLSNTIIKKNSEEEPLIAHLDLKLDDIDLSEIEDSSEVDDSLFLKSSTDINNDLLSNKSEINLQSDNLNCVNSTIKSSKEEKIDEIEDKIFNLKFELHKLLKNSSINIEKSEFSKNTKCWWCKNCFKT